MEEWINRFVNRLEVQLGNNKEAFKTKFKADKMDIGMIQCMSVNNVKEYFQLSLAQSIAVVRELVTRPRNDWEQCFQRPEFVEARSGVPPAQVIVRLSADELSGSGLVRDGSEISLYVREMFTRQHNFLSQKVLTENSVGFIYGPPGTGKSTATYAFVTNLDRSWITTWLHCSDQYPVYCVRFERERRIVRTIVNGDADEVARVLNDVENDENHLVILDGYSLQAEGSIRKISDVCHVWLKKDLDRRRLAKVSSMAARGLGKSHEDAVERIEYCFVACWELDDYFQAAAKADFFENVKDKLDSNIELNDIRDASDEVDTTTISELSAQDKVLSKHFYAGGSCRFMFQLNTESVIQDISTGIHKIHDPLPYFMEFRATQQIALSADFSVPIQTQDLSEKFAS